MSCYKYRLASLDTLDSPILKLVKSELVLLWFNLWSFPICGSLVVFWCDKLMRAVFILVSLAHEVCAVVAETLCFFLWS